MPEKIEALAAITQMMVQALDQIILHPPATCSLCQHDMCGEPIEKIIRHQVVDPPAYSLLVSEHQAQSKRCPHCHGLTMAHFSQDVTAPVQYGVASNRSRWPSRNSTCFPMNGSARS